MELTEAERLIIINQCKILEVLKPEESEYYQKAVVALESGFKPVYQDVLPSFSKKEISQHQAEFVYEVFNMFDALYRYEQTTGMTIFSPYAKFSGFDGHGDLVGFARFNVEVLKRWTWLNVQEFDAHMPIEQMYERILAVWVEKPVSERYDLTMPDVDKIMKAAIHPKSSNLDQTSEEGS